MASVVGVKWRTATGYFTLLNESGAQNKVSPPLFVLCTFTNILEETRNMLFVPSQPSRLNTTSLNLPSIRRTLRYGMESSGETLGQDETAQPRQFPVGRDTPPPIELLHEKVVGHG